MLRNIIRQGDTVYVVERKLSPTTSEEDATRIHNLLETKTLLRDGNGNWYCCNIAQEVAFRDIDPAEDYSHTQFELGDNGGLG